MTIIVQPIAEFPYSNLLREVMLHLPMAPEFEVEYRLKMAVRDFCRDSRAWRQINTTLLTTVANQVSYDADLPSGTELVAVLSAWDGSTELDVELPGEQDDYEPNSSDSCWKVGVEPTLDAIRLSPAPDVSGTVVTGTVCFAPNDDSTSMPDFVYKRWRKVVSAGCIAAMKEQTNKPWSDPGGAMFFQKRFTDGIAEASNMYGPVRRRPLRVTPY